LPKPYIVWGKGEAVGFRVAGGFALIANIRRDEHRRKTCLGAGELRAYCLSALGGPCSTGRASAGAACNFAVRHVGIPCGCDGRFLWVRCPACRTINAIDLRAPWTADAQNVVKIISSDKRKAQIYCQIAELSDEIDQEENPTKTEELSQKIDNLEQKLGAEYATLVGNLKDIDPNSQDAREIGSILEALDRLCED
jgi:hypothetical protein